MLPRIRIQRNRVSIYKRLYRTISTWRKRHVLRTSYANSKNTFFDRSKPPSSTRKGHVFNVPTVETIRYYSFHYSTTIVHGSVDFMLYAAGIATTT